MDEALFKVRSVCYDCTSVMIPAVACVRHGNEQAKNGFRKRGFSSLSKQLKAHSTEKEFMLT